MAVLQRIQFADDDIGTNAYLFVYNPTELEYPDGDEYIKVKCYGSEAANQKVYWDPRELSMIWRNYTPSMSNFVSQLSVLISYKGAKKYINFGTINGLILEDSSTWKGPFRIVDVIPSIKKGGSTIWETVELKLEKAGA